MRYVVYVTDTESRKLTPLALRRIYTINGYNRYRPQAKHEYKGIITKALVVPIKKLNYNYTTNEYDDLVKKALKLYS